MKIKHKFTIYNLILLITPVFLIGVISLCYLVVFILKFPVETLYITRAELLSPRTLARVIGSFLQSNPKAISYIASWFVLCLLTLAATTTVITFRMTRIIERPINDLTRAADSIRGGSLDFEVLGSDISEIDSLCRSFDEMRKTLRSARRREEEMTRERSLLIANISHDLKTPVTSIKGYVDGIRDGIAASPEKQRQYLDTIYAKADTIDSMVNTLSEYSRAELSAYDLKFETGDVNEFLNTFIEDCRIETERRGAVLVNEVSRESAMARLDREKLSRAFTNIIDNAIKYGGDKPRLDVSSQLRDGGVYITFRDYGIGIAEEELDRVYDTFYRADASRSVSGSGLGLGIVKRIIERHGGRIWINSSGIGRGTRVTVFLPTV